MKRLNNILEEVILRLDIKVKNYESIPNTSENSLALDTDVHIDSQHGIVELTNLIVKYPTWLDKLSDDALRGGLAHELGHITRSASMYKNKVGRSYESVASFARKYESSLLGRTLLSLFEIDVNMQLEKQGFKTNLDALRKFYKERGFKIY
jgi:hypothetical protein